MENLKTQVNSGAMTLAQARGELASAQLEAATGLGQAQASLSAGEMAIQMQEAQAQAAGSEADLAAAGMGDLLSRGNSGNLAECPEFSDAGRVCERGWN